MEQRQKPGPNLEFRCAFLTEEEHRTIRTLTQILSWTQPLLGKKRPVIDSSGHATRGTREARQESQYKLLNSFLRSIDRGGSETIAMLPGRLKASGFALFAGGSQQALEESSQVHEQQNDEHDRSPSNAQQNGIAEQPSTLKGVRCTVQFKRHEVPGGFVHDPLAYFIDLVEKHDHDIPSTLIVQLSSALLKHGHMQVGKEARRKSYDDFNVFMTCIGLNRLWERFDFGATSRNFYQIIRLLDEDEPTPASLVAAASKLMSPCADWERYTKFDHSTKHTGAVFKEILKNLEFVSTAEYVQSQKFDQRPHRCLYKILSIILGMLQDRLNRARLYHPPKGRQWAFDRAAFGEAIHALQKTMRSLGRLVVCFREEIRSTLEWVARVCQLKDGTWRGLQGGFREIGALLEGEEVISLEEIKTSRRCIWPEACLQWLELLVVQQTAIRDIHMWAPSRKHPPRTLRLLVPRAKVHTIEFRSLSGDRYSCNMNDIQQELEAVRWLPKPHRKALTLWLERNSHEGLDFAQFKGSVHCETMLLTLHALTLPGAFTWTFPSVETISKCLRSHNIMVSPQVIARLQNARGVLGLSRRCCPGCRVVVFAIRDLQDLRQRISPPPCHGVWLPMALPPWTPRRIGLHLLDHLRHEVRYRAQLAFNASPREEQEELRRLFRLQADVEFDLDLDSESCPFPRSESEPET